VISAIVFSSDVVLVLFQQPHRLLQRIAPERVAQLACHHHFQDGGLALLLRRAGGAQGRADVGPALAAACAAQKEGRTTVLEMMVTRELGDPFRRDALSKPVRLLDKYKNCM
jgi:hypothetical protein